VIAIRFHDPEPICLSYEVWLTLSGNVSSRMTDFCVLEVLRAVHAFCMNIRVEFISVIKQLDAQDFCFTISLFHASTCFEHMCSSSGVQNCITQPLASSHL